MDITKLFIEVIKNCEEYSEAVNIVKRNSSGKVWLIGGFIYRTIASELYGLPKPEVDLDFIIEAPVTDFDLPDGWTVSINRFGNPKLINGNKYIDYVPLNNIHSIIERELDPTIDNFLSGAPLTIQSIAFDVYENKIIGELGINALHNKVIEVNDLTFAEYAAQKKNKALRAMMQEKADELNFKLIL